MAMNKNPRKGLFLTQINLNVFATLVDLHFQVNALNLIYTQQALSNQLQHFMYTIMY